jgi:hypothetical protein
MVDAWFIPDLSLPTELQMEADRRAAAKLSRDELNILADKLICDWYQQRELIDRALGRVRHLEVELALAGPPVPARREPEPQHLEWARELLRQPPT